MFLIGFHDKMALLKAVENKAKLVLTFCYCAITKKHVIYLPALATMALKRATFIKYGRGILNKLHKEKYFID